VALLRTERERLRERVEVWHERKAAGLAAMREPGFWEQDDRGAVLALIEYVERLEADWRTGERLQGRLDRGNGRPAAEGVRILAQRVYLLGRALNGLDAGQAADAFLRVSLPDAEPSADAVAFAGELLAMYESWARARGMRIERAGADGHATTLAVAGLAAYPILADETGIHVLELPSGKRSFDRIAVRVTVAPRSFGGPEEGLQDAAAEALSNVSQQRRVVRRYRREPSPLVRDAVRGWRTGRLDRVLAGDFDVVE
jgi:ATP-dependent Clp protease ATP-binding subunit ClpC